MAHYQNRIGIYTKGDKEERQIKVNGNIIDAKTGDKEVQIEFSILILGIEHHFLVDLPDEGDTHVNVQPVDWEDKPLFDIRGLVKSNPRGQYITFLVTVLFQQIVAIIPIPAIDDEDTKTVSVIIKQSDMQNRKPYFTRQSKENES